MRSFFRSRQPVERCIEVGKQNIVSRTYCQSNVVDNLRRESIALVESLKIVETAQSRVTRLNRLINHILYYPETRSLLHSQKLVPILTKMREKCRDKDDETQALLRQSFAMMGHTQSCKGKGIRILSIDGGGSRGIISVEILKRIEEMTGQRTYELFDLVCGSSTGAIVSFLLCSRYLTVGEAEEAYRRISLETFKQNKLVGGGKLFMAQSYYDTGAWTKTLKKHLTEDETLIQTSRDSRCPKLIVVSTVANRSVLRPFLFRNYDYDPRIEAHYPGSYTNALWEAIRASTAAPGYFDECRLDGNVHQDGGLLTNNPTAIALHEARQIWGRNTPIQCVVSLGNGKRPLEDPKGKQQNSWWIKNWQDKLIQLIFSATDTEAVDTVLRDVLAPGTYFRFNPTLSEDLDLDENRGEKLDLMVQDTRSYLRQNLRELELAALALSIKRSRRQIFQDWYRCKMNGFLPP